MKITIDLASNTSTVPWLDHEWVAIIIAIVALSTAFYMARKQLKDSRDIAKKNKAIEILLTNEKKMIHEDGMSVLRKYKSNGKEKLIARLAETKLFKIKISKLELDMNNLCSCKDNSEEQKQIIKTKIKKIKIKQKMRIKDRESLLDLLNYYEYIAIAIRKNIICNELMFYANHSSFVWIFELSKPFIDALQNDQKTVFCEIVDLHNKWLEQREDLGYT